MSEPSPNGTGATNGNGSGPPASGPLARLPGESGTAYLNRQREAKAQHEAQQRQAQERQECERLDALMTRAEQLVQMLERVAGAIPPDLSQQLAAVRSETQEARSAAAQVRTAATSVTSAGTTVTRAAESFAATTSKAETWHKLLTATEERGTKTAQAIERAAAGAGREVRSVRWRAWLTGGVGPTLLLLALGGLFWIVDPLRAAVAAWWMTADQQLAVTRGALLMDIYQSSKGTVVDRCLIEAYAGWAHREATPCPPPPPGSGLNAVHLSTRPTPKRGK